MTSKGPTKLYWLRRNQCFINVSVARPCSHEEQSGM